MTIIEIEDVRKEYGGLQPLRVAELRVDEGEVVALSGFDAASAEILVNLLTGATLPDKGTVRVFGEDTAGVGDADAWLSGLDRLGIVSDRAALLDELTVAQNLALPLTLRLDPLPPDIRATVSRLAGEIDLDSVLLDVPARSLDPGERLRLRLGRSLALGPRLLLVEHPTTSLASVVVPRMAEVFREVMGRRRLTGLVIAEDRVFAKATADRRLTLDRKSGRLKQARGWWG